LPSSNAGSPGDVSPPPIDARRHDWGTGVFQTARRLPTPWVEGRLEPTSATIMVTLRGGAQHHELVTDDGYRYAGPDIAGSISFLPGGCGRRLALKNVSWQWASVTVKPEVLVDAGITVSARPFCVTHDAAVLSLLAEMDRLHALDGRLDATYCDSISVALTHYVGQRYWQVSPAASRDRDLGDRLPSWRLRRVIDYIEANIASEIAIRDLTDLLDLSEGHFHRAFRATTGQTPLAFITARRIERAQQGLATSDEPIGRIAADAGFVSQSHFARTFRAKTGISPRTWRQRFKRY
jgi:AraC family transcriptional regulator